jgi:hypothetical protein
MSPLDQQTLGEVICGRLTEEILKLGFPEDSLPPGPAYGQASFASAIDPGSRLESLVGTWRNGQGYRVGEIILHGDGSFYAEYDVALPHPTNSRWFVEAVVAWGRGDIVKAEAKLLPALG